MRRRSASEMWLDRDLIHVGGWRCPARSCVRLGQRAALRRASLDEGLTVRWSALGDRGAARLLSNLFCPIVHGNRELCYPRPVARVSRDEARTVHDVYGSE